MHSVVAGAQYNYFPPTLSHCSHYEYIICRYSMHTISVHLLLSYLIIIEHSPPSKSCKVTEKSYLRRHESWKQPIDQNVIVSIASTVNVT